jgi:hypothetical protein
MRVIDAQREVRTVFEGGFFGQIVSGLIWLASAALATWASPRAAILTLVLGGFFIFPVTTGVLVLLRRPHALSAANPFRHLAMQVAFVLPLSMPLVAPVAAHRLAWFFPAMMVLVGAHYLPFVTLYGMRSFAVLCGVLVSAGIGIAFLAPASFALGGWVTAAVLVVFAFIGRAEASRSEAGLAA